MEDSETFSKLNSFTFPQTRRLNVMGDFDSKDGTARTANCRKEKESETEGDGKEDVEPLDQPPVESRDFTNEQHFELSPKSTILRLNKNQFPQQKRPSPEISEPASSATPFNDLPSSVVPYPSIRRSSIIINKRRSSRQQSVSSLSPITLPDRTFGKSQEYTTGRGNNSDDNNSTYEPYALNPPAVRRTSSWSTKRPAHCRSLSISSNPISIDSLTTTPLTTMNSGSDDNNHDCVVPGFQSKLPEIGNHSVPSKNSSIINDDEIKPTLSLEYFDDENTRIMKTPSSASSYTIGEAEAINIRRPSIVYIVSSPTNLKVDLNVIEH